MTDVPIHPFAVAGSDQPIRLHRDCRDSGQRRNFMFSLRVVAEQRIQQRMRHFPPTLAKWNARFLSSWTLAIAKSAGAQ